MARPKQEKFCKQCAALLKDRHSIFCNNKCHQEFLRLTRIQKWLSGVVPTSLEVPTAIRQYLLGCAGFKCQQCGWSGVNPKSGQTTLTIDHIDGNGYDHHKENLRVLCLNCHSLTPTYGNLNRGFGRQKRYAPIENRTQISSVPEK